MLISLEAKLIGFLVLVLALVGGGWYLHHAGYEQAKSEFTAEITKANQAAAIELQVKNEQVRVIQDSLEKAQTTIIEKDKETENAKNDFEALRAEYLNSSKRMYVAAYRPSSPAKQSDNSTTSTGTDEIRVQLMPAVSESILDIARGYKENVRLKNECIDLYNSARDAVNKEQ